MQKVISKFCDQSVDRMVLQDLWCYNMPKEINGREPYSNNTFEIIPYDYDDEQEYNFYHKPSGLKIMWYKYPLRGILSNMEISPSEFRAAILDCVNSFNKDQNIRVTDGTFKKWWEDEKFDEQD